MDETPKEGLIDQLKRLVQEAIDYLSSALALQQARFLSFTLSGFLFVLQVSFAFLLAIAAFILLNIAVGMALAKLFGNNLYSILVLSGIYILLAALLSWKALRWLRKLRS